ncbi:MAG TPA: EAL domain-containing protein [Gammaproteobacteria bacterium]|nr:EAL domain-containing protein [Gammaproteobacteria bacterium]
MSPVRLRVLGADASAVDRLRRLLADHGYRPRNASADGEDQELVLDPPDDSGHVLPTRPGPTASLLDGVDEPLLLCDADGSLALANRAAAELLDLSANGLPLFCSDGRTPLPPEEYPCQLALHGEGPVGRRLAARSPQGGMRQVLVRAEPVTDSAGHPRGVVATLHDLTDQEEAQQRLRRQRDLYAALSEVNQFVVLRDPDPQSMFDGVCRIAVEYGGLRLAWVGIPDDRGWVRPAASHGEASEYLRELAISIDPARPESRGPTGTAMREDRHVVEPTISTDPSMSPWHAAAEAVGLRSSAAFPVHRGGEVAASLNVYAGATDYFSEDLLHLLDEMVLDIAFALDNHDREAEHRRLVEIIEATPDFVGLADTDGTVLYHNPAALGLLGRDRSSGRVADFHTPHSLERLQQVALPTAREQGVWRGESEIVNADGEPVPFSQTIIAHRDPQGQVTHFSTIARDISEQKRADAEIRRLAYRDPVTGLANRANLLERLDQELSRARRQQMYGALLYLDLDQFKAINDSLGHPAGDALLRALGQRLLESVRPEDVVARVGGDELVVLIPDLGTQAEAAAVQAEQLAEKLLAAIGRAFELDDHRLFITASLGLTLFPEAGSTRDILLQQADAAMYNAKGEGPGNLRFFHPEMLEAVRQRLDLEQELRGALERGELALAYQPMIALDRPESPLVGLEALVRWNHPRRGPISPAEFIPVAEDSGLILDVGNWVLEEAFGQLGRWQAAGLSPGPQGLGINISPRQFAHHDFVDRIDRLLKRTGVPAHWIKLEITEHLLIQHLGTAVERMQALRELGLSFAVDDFGTGYSSLSYLHRLPVTTLKIDRSLVADVEGPTSSAVIVEAVLAMADRLGLGVVAEGVETASQAEFLARRGGTTGQGFLWAAAEPAAEVTGRLPPASRGPPPG